MTTDNEQYYGLATPVSGSSQFNELRFTIQQQMLKLNTSMPVQVVSVKTTGLAPVGFVGIRILVDQVTGDGMTFPHAEIPNVPYFRLQGGSNAVIIDPEVGDIGMASFCSRDISAVKNARQSAPPGSARSYDFSDCAYFGGILNGTPTQYIHFTSGGIVITSPNAVTVNAPVSTVNSDTVKVNSENATITASTAAAISSPSLSLGNVGSTLRRLIDERFVALFNSHTHPTNGAPPTQQITNELTDSAKAN